MTTLKTFYRILRRYKFVPIKPPRSDIKPGFIINRKGQGIIATDQSCFPSRDIPRKFAKLEIGELRELTQTNYSADIDTALGQVVGPVSIPKEVKLGFEKSIKKEVNLVHGGISSEYITEHHVYKRILKLRPGHACYWSLSKRNAIVILEALKVNKLSYTFRKKGTLNFDAVLGWLEDLISARGKIVRKTEEYFTLTITEPRYIAYKFMPGGPKYIKKLQDAGSPPPLASRRTQAARASLATYRRSAVVGTRSRTGRAAVGRVPSAAMPGVIEYLSAKEVLGDRKFLEIR